MTKSTKLAKLALEARLQAYAPYSNFYVGAAVEMESGAIYTGANIENAAYSPSCCGERVAIFKAISETKEKVVRMAVAGGVKGRAPSAYVYPCGVCRQVLAEFASIHCQIILVTDENQTKTMSLGELLPFAFSGESFLVEESDSSP